MLLVKQILIPFIRFDAAEQIFNQYAGQTLEGLYNLIEFWNEAKKLILNTN